MIEVSIIGLILLALILFFIKCTYKRDEMPKKHMRSWDAKATFDISEENITDVFINEGEKLRILQLTDIHYDLTNSKKQKTLELIASVIANHPVNIITVTGDWCGDKKNVKANARVVFDIIDRYGIPWAPVFGAVDDEGDLSRVDYISLFDEYKNCIFKVGYTNIGGIGDYIVNVREKNSNKLLMSLFMMDSNGEIGFGKSKLEPIWKKQIEWYSWAIDGLNIEYKKEFGEDKTIPSLAFFHIPLPEFLEVYNKPECILSGKNKQKPCVPKKNTGFAEKIVSKNSTKAIFVGHDHENNATMDYKGVKLVYGMQSGWSDNSSADSVKGSLLIEADRDGNITTDEISFDI